MATTPTLDCSNGLSIYTVDNWPEGPNPGNNGSFLLNVEALYENGFTIYDNITPFVVYEGNIYSAYDPYDALSPQGVQAVFYGTDPVDSEYQGIPTNGAIEFYLLNGDKVYQLMNPINYFGGAEANTFQNGMAIFTNNSSVFEEYCTLQLTDFQSVGSVPILVSLMEQLQQNQDTVENNNQENAEIANESDLPDSTIEAVEDSGINISNQQETQEDIESGETNEDTTQIVENIDSTVETLEESSDILDNISPEDVPQEQIEVIQGAINAEPVNMDSSSSTENTNFKNLIIAGLGGAVLLSLLKK
jgi:hypothetical protein